MNNIAQHSNDALAQLIGQCGLSYVFDEIVSSSKQVADPVTRKLWAAAERALDDVYSHLCGYVPDDDDEEYDDEEYEFTEDEDYVEDYDDDDDDDEDYVEDYDDDDDEDC